MFSASLNTRDITDLVRELRQGAVNGLRVATGRGAEIMREEAPEDEGTLRKGIKPRVDEQAMRGEIEASAVRPSQPAREETVVLANGRAKRIKFRAQREYDYARAVAEGTGLYGARGQEIKPKAGRKKLRFEVAGGIVFAGSVEGQRPNPFPERAADRLELEADGIVGREVEKAID